MLNEIGFNGWEEWCYTWYTRLVVTKAAFLPCSTRCSPPLPPLGPWAPWAVGCDHRTVPPQGVGASPVPSGPATARHGPAPGPRERVRPNGLPGESVAEVQS